MLVSYFNTDDTNHEKALKIMPEILAEKFGRVFISDYIFDETTTVIFARAGNREKANKAGHSIFLANMSFLKVNERIFMEAWKFFTQTKLPMSFTDCTCVAILKSYSIDYIATFDKDFKKVPGVKVIP